MKRSRLFVSLLFLLCVMPQMARAADDTIYAVNFNSPARVLTIHPTTGVATNAGTLSFGSAAAAIDPISGNIFYTEYNPFGSSAGRVAYWNPTTGTNTIINSTGPGFQIPRLAFNSTGTLYGMDASNNLYTISTVDGQFTLLGTVSGVTPTSGGDLAFAADGTLYLLAGGTLYTIDTLSLSASTLFNTGISNPTGLTFGDNNILYASNLDTNADIYTINLSTGVTSPTTSTAGTLVDDLLSLPKFANLSITKAASSSFIVGSTATYTLTVNNAGPQSAGANIVVRDTLPTGITFNSYTATGWTCSAAGQVVTCTRTSAMAAGTNSTITLTVNVLSTAASSVNNTATVDSPTFDPNTANNSSTVTTAVTVPPDLRITKTHSGNFFQGQNPATYTITVTNNGSGPTVGTVTVTDTLPTGLTFVSNGGTGWGGACSASGQVVTCTRSTTLNAGSSYPALTINVSVASNAPASVTNSVAVAVGGELVTNNNSATDATTINGRPDLTIAKSHTGNFTQGQTNASYTITVTNAGRAATTAAMTVTDTLPAGLTFVSGTGTNWNNCTASGQTVTCTRSTAIAALASSNITLLVNVSATAPASVTNAVSISGGGETNTGNNSATDDTTINQFADMTIAKTHTGNFTRGGSGTYTLTATNSGAGATSGTVTVTDTLPAAFSNISANGTGWTCNIVSQTVTCTRSDVLNAGESYPAISITITVAQNAASSVTNTASVSGGGQLVTSNDSSSDPTTIVSSSDLSLTKVTNNSGNGIGTNATFTVTINNAGPTNATNVAVRDQLPAGFTYVSSTPSAGTYNSGTGVWAVGSLASGASATLQLVARIDVLGALTNTAQVTASDQPDPDSTPNNNNASEDDQASSSLSTSPPDVSLCKTILGQACPPPALPALPGSDLAYVITFTNTGGSPAASFVITDPIPANTDFKVGSVTANLGTTGLSLTLITPNDRIAYSNDGGATWTYTPASGGGGAPAGYDRSVTHIRWSFIGNLSQTAPNNTGNGGFMVRIR